MTNEPGQVKQDCLRVSVVLRTILQHFSTHELVRLALVNKFWSYEARSLLRDRGSLALAINRKYNSSQCEDIRALASDLRRSKAITGVLPLSGLTIDLDGLNGTHTDWCTGSPTTEMNEIYDYILSQISWKSLAVEFSGHWTEEFVNCSGFVLVKKILQKFGSVLQVLWLTFPSEREEILQVLQLCNFPRLVNLRIENSEAPNEGYTSWIKTIVTRAPNLKLLETFNYVNLSGNLLEGSSAVHVTGHPYSVLLNEVPESLVGTFQMTFMHETDISQDFQLDRFNRITSGILEASRTTLSSMIMDVVFLVPLMAYGICLENVTTLEISIDPPKVYDEPELDDPQLEEEENVSQVLLRLANTFDFTRIFPNLKAVKLELYSEFYYFYDGIQEMIEREKASVVDEPMPGRAVNIKNLKVECKKEIDDSGIEFITEMFPAVEELSVQGTEIPFDRIWESWPHLKALDVKDVPMRSVVRNLDSVFCGISPEEVAQLREEDEEYLRSVNIVPVMPSITCLKDLRTLNFKFSESSMGPLNDPTYLFSKVTGLIAFQRCPALTVTLTTSDERRQEALSHLSSYATIL